MNIADLSEYDLRVLATADQTDLGRLLQRIATQEADELLTQIERNLRVNTENVSEDFRFKFGQRKGIKQFLGWSHEAAKALKKHERGQT